MENPTSEKPNLRTLILPWLSIAILWLFYCHQYILRLSVSALDARLCQCLHIQAFTISMVSASFYYSYVLLQIFSGLLIDRYGCRILLTMATLLCTIGGFIFTFSYEVRLLELARVLMGAGASFSFISIIYLAKAWFNKQKFTVITGVTIMVGTIGAILGSSLLLSLSNKYPWRIIMLNLSIISLILTILMPIFVREPAYLIKERMEKRSLGVFTFFKQNLINVVKLPQLWLIGIYLGLSYIAIIVFASLWSIPYFQLLYGQHSVFAIYSPLFMFGGYAVGAVVVSWICSYNNKPVFLLRLCNILYVISFSLIIFTRLPEFVAFILLVFSGFCLGATMIVLVLVNEWVSDQFRATGISFAVLLQFAVGSLALPIVGYILRDETGRKAKNFFGLVTTHDYHVGFSVMFIAIILGTIVSFLLKRPKKLAVV